MIINLVFILYNYKTITGSKRDFFKAPRLAVPQLLASFVRFATAAPYKSAAL